MGGTAGSNPACSSGESNELRKLIGVTACRNGLVIGDVVSPIRETHGIATRNANGGGNDLRRWRGSGRNHVTFARDSKGRSWK
jgi:hypothetical protein